MGFTSSNNIPVIEFSILDLTPGTSSWCSVRTEVRQALEAYGCFEAVFGEIQLGQAMLGAMKQLFDLPLETRLRHPPNDRYKGFNPHTPLYGNMGISDVLGPERLQSFTNLMWPEGNSQFCETVSSYVTQSSNMERMVKRMIFESFGVESYCDSLEESTTYFLRLNKYRLPNINETNLGLSPHTDSSYMSILSQNDVNGLEIQAKDGRWINVTPSASSFIVLVGDALMAWSNGRLHAVPHRVYMNGNSVRYSMALFAFIKGIIQSPEELVDEKHPLLFKPFDHFGFRRFLTSEEGLEAESAIKAYCGV